MNRWLAISVVALGFAINLVVPLAALASTQDYSVPVFDADYYLSRDPEHLSHLRVHEHIIVSFPASDQNHGIERSIPNITDNHSVDLQLQSVTDDAGHKLAYSTDSSLDNTVVRIGDAHRYVHGNQSYNLDYTMDNVTVNQVAYDGNFWDTNGDDWEQVVGQVIARVHLASDVAATLLPAGSRCFTGPRGSTAQDCTVSTAEPTAGDTVLTFTATRPLQPKETLTYEVRFQPGTFAGYKMTAAQLQREIVQIGLKFVAPALLVLWFMLRQWRKYGRDPRGRGVIVPEYLPTKEISVVGSGILLDEKLKPKAITAQIIDLAIRGYVKIYETKLERRFQPDKTSYNLEYTQSSDDLPLDEQAVLRLLFEAQPVGSVVELDKLKNTLATRAKHIAETAGQLLAEHGLFRTDPGKAKAPYFVAGSIMLGLASAFPNQAMGLVLPALIVLGIGNFMPARTATGVTERDYLLGLKQFISIAEADRIRTLQSPRSDLMEKIDVNDATKLVKLYERLLPYAMLFGLENDWANQFAALYQHPPDWYLGSNGFSVRYFSRALAQFNSVSRASFTPPVSSRSGGFAGGGGGGGGGRGW